MAYTFLWFCIWLVQQILAYKQILVFNYQEQDNLLFAAGLYFFNFVELFLEFGLYGYILYISCDLKRSLNAIKRSTRSNQDISKEGKNNIQSNIKKIKIFFAIIFFTMILGSIV